MTNAKWKAPISSCFILHSSLFVLVFALSLGLRLIARDVAITADEDNWMKRAGGFAFGLLNAQLGRTYQNGHPAVTTMWVATLTLGPERMVQYSRRVDNQRFVGRVAGFWEALIAARVGFAVVTAGLVGLISLLTWRLLGPWPGLFAGLVAGLEPFYLAISQLVHMDAILSGCMVASVLAALVGWSEPGGRRWMAVSGVLAGLALLSKSPAAFLLLFVPVLGVVSNLTPHPPSHKGRGIRPPLPLWEGGLGGLGLDLLVWGLALAVTVVGLWPAIWVLGPWEVLGRVVSFARETGGQPHEGGSFFWGEPRPEPGPLFYPVALAFRLAPLTMLGIVLLAATWRQLPIGSRRVVLALVAYSLGFLAMMTLGAKKFDRYLLPIFPALGVIAALGLWTAIVNLTSQPASLNGRAGLLNSPPFPSGKGARGLGICILVALVALWPLAASYPYYLSYYNPLLGGGAAAQRTVMVGNGEGLDQVAKWLNARPDAENLWVVSHSFDILQPLIVGSGEPLRDRVPPNADYVVLYRFQIQVAHGPRVLAEYLERHTSELTVWVDGIEYARVYRGPHLAS
ncbi:MAG TPA: glycosyltransferase family 39 protein [Chloroflexota bacterium]|nr:glycosyltransferase family 39 protein [Chloroflexota bacterium]